MRGKLVVALMLMSVGLAGCTGSENADTTEMDGETSMEIDCAPLLDALATTTQEEYDELPEEEQLPEECADQFVAYIGPLTEYWSDGCTYAGIQNLLPREAWGEPPEGFSFDESNGQIVIISLLLECDSITYRNGTINDGRLVLHWLEVEGHADWGDDELNHRYIFSGITQSKEMLEVYHEFGYDVVDQATINVQSQQPKCGFLGGTIQLLHQ